MARLSKQDWLNEGFKLLSEFAQDKLRIQYLCDRLKVTRGSFYHHFNGIEDYVAGLLEDWEQKNTLELIQGANQGKSPEERMQILAELVAAKDQKVEAAVRSWSFYHPIVQKHLARVDKIRLNYLEQIFADMGFEARIAKNRAKLDYATLIGVQQLFPSADRTELDELWTVQREIMMK